MACFQDGQIWERRKGKGWGEEKEVIEYTKYNSKIYKVYSMPGTVLSTLNWISIATHPHDTDEEKDMIW